MSGKNDWGFPQINDKHESTDKGNSENITQINAKISTT